MDLKDFEIMALSARANSHLRWLSRAGAHSIYFGIENLNMPAVWSTHSLLKTFGK